MDDCDRACEADGFAALIAVGAGGAQALALGDEPATTRCLPEHRLFARWLGAVSEAGPLAAAAAVLPDPATEWEESGVGETDGPVVLMDSAEAGDAPHAGYPSGKGLPSRPTCRSRPAVGQYEPFTPRPMS